LKFDEIDRHSSMGGLKRFGKALDNGMVLVLSLWDDHEANMLWLDSDYPLNLPREKTGV
jgi:cellulose 1,4-beta-cellobiosidase